MRAIASFVLGLSLLPIATPAFAQTANQGDADKMDAAISYVLEHGMLRLEADGEFHPDEKISRIQLLSSIVHDIYPRDIRQGCFDDIAPSVPARYTHLFTDVTTRAGFAKEVCTGMLVGIVQGQPEGSFRPHANVTLAEASKVISKAYGIAPFLGLKPNPRVPWHEPYWYSLAKNQAIPRTVTDRHNTITRGEFAEILYALRGNRPPEGFRFSKTPVRGTIAIVKTPSLTQKVSKVEKKRVQVTAKTEAGNAIQKHVSERLNMRLALKEGKYLSQKMPNSEPRQEHMSLSPW